MTAADLAALSPFLVLAGGPVVIMLVVAFRRHHLLTVVLTLASLAVAFVLSVVRVGAGTRQVTSLLRVDDYALFFTALIAAAAFAVAALSYGYLERLRGNSEEFYLLLLLATLGSAVLVAANHFASFFLGLEILSVSLYALISYSRFRLESVEAGVKYLILAGVSSAFLLFGLALIYAQTGTMEFPRLGSVRIQPGPGGWMWLAGVAMMVAGIGFKLAVVPFHLWTPDVYQGAPAPSTAFVATVSKGAMVALLLRFAAEAGIYAHGSILLLFVVIAIASMLAGNLLALLQENVKRILAYSSISHLGYLLVAFLAGGALGVTAVAFYLVAYFVTTLGAFAVVTLLSGQDRDADALEDYRGLFWRRPWLAGAFTAMLLSLAGIPLTAGFVGKFYVVLAGVGSAEWLLVATLVVGSGIGIFYYLRLAVAMYTPMPAQEDLAIPAPRLSAAGSLVLAALVLLLVGLGVYPSWLVQAIQATVGRLT